MYLYAPNSTLARYRFYGLLDTMYMAMLMPQRRVLTGDIRDMFLFLSRAHVSRISSHRVVETQYLDQRDIHPSFFFSYHSILPISRLITKRVQQHSAEGILY